MQCKHKRTNRLHYNTNTPIPVVYNGDYENFYSSVIAWASEANNPTAIFGNKKTTKARLGNPSPDFFFFWPSTGKGPYLSFVYVFESFPSVFSEM